MSLKLEKDGIKIENLGLTLLCSTQNKKGMIYRNELSIKWEPTHNLYSKNKNPTKKEEERQVQMLQAQCRNTIKNLRKRGAGSNTIAQHMAL